MEYFSERFRTAFSTHSSQEGLQELTNNNDRRNSKTPKATESVATETKPVAATKKYTERWSLVVGNRSPKSCCCTRVRIKSWQLARFNVNKKDLTEYFSELRDHQDIVKVLEKTNTKGLTRYLCEIQMVAVIPDKREQLF